MKLLVINFEMDPASKVLAWQHQVVAGLAEHCERVFVLSEGGRPGVLPGNVEVHFVPRWLQRAPLRWLGGRWAMLLPFATWLHRERFDACFIHMNMSWAYRFGPLLRAAGVPIVMWYAHGAVSPGLVRAHRWVDRVLTSTAEGFRLPSDKRRIIGQGIDLDMFIPGDEREDPRRDIITVGRLAPSKRIDLIISIFARMLAYPEFSHARLLIAGDVIAARDNAYVDRLRSQVAALQITERVEFLGHVPREQLPKLYSRAQLHLNFSVTGSMDKTVMESLACGCPVLTSNDAFAHVFAGEELHLCRTDSSDPERIAAQASELIQRRLQPTRLRALVEGSNDLSSYVRKVMAELQEVRAQPSHS